MRLMTFWQYAHNFPPALVRLLARHRYGAPLTTEEISNVSGLSAAKVEFISQGTASWREVLLSDVAPFLRGCGLDFCNSIQMRRVAAYLRKQPSFEYLRKSPRYETYYKPLLTRWRREWKDTKTTAPYIRNLAKRLSPILNEHAK